MSSSTLLFTVFCECFLNISRILVTVIGGMHWNYLCSINGKLRRKGISDLFFFRVLSITKSLSTTLLSLTSCHIEHLRLMIRLLRKGNINLCQPEEKKKFNTCLVSHKNSVIKVKLVQCSRMPLNRLKYVRSSVGVSRCVGSKTHLSPWSVTNNCQQHTAREEKMSMSNRRNIFMTQGLCQPEEMLDFHLY